MVLTDKGFARPSYDDLLQRQSDRAKVLFGDDIDTSEQSVLGKYIRINVQDLAECYELLEGIYYARFPGSARGQNLERLCAFAGIARNPATHAKIKVRFHGKAGAAIPAAFLLAGSGMTYYMNADYAIGSSGECEALATCTVAGELGNLPSGTELSIVRPSPDLRKAEYISIEAYGQNREGDTALRLRFGKSISGSGSATMNAIRGAISRVPLVDGVTIIENDSDTTTDGRPPNSFECYVLAPESQDGVIAKAIFGKKPLGIKCVGTEEVQLVDDGGKTHHIRFSRTVQKEIHVRVKIKVNQNFEVNGDDRIKDNLLEHINNLTNGEMVYLSGLYGCIHKIQGVVNVQELMLSEDGASFTAGNIGIGEYEIARTGNEKIGIEVVE